MNWSWKKSILRGNFALILLLVFNLMIYCKIEPNPKLSFIFSLAANSSTNSNTQISLAINVSGLSGTGLVLQTNLSDNLSITANGIFSFANPMNLNQAYSITILNQPTNPVQSCVISNAIGTIVSSQNIVSITCSIINVLYSLSVNVSGLSGTGLVLQNNLSDNLAVTANGIFNFTNVMTFNQTYSITILTKPSNPDQSCIISSPIGNIVSTQNTVSVVCSNLILSYTGSPYSYFVNSAITPIIPSLTGVITSCTSSPALPTGLSLVNTTCAITGNPTVIQAATNYIITAGNTNGATTANLNLAITAMPPAPTSLVYPSNLFVLKQNSPVPTITPTMIGTVTSCSSAPSLPLGLSINGTTCAITGTPTTLQGSTAYVVTASNAGGSTTANFSIIVQAVVFKIFITASTYNGDLVTAGGGANGALSADILCNLDTNKPNASIYKAVIIDSANRTAVPSFIDWVLIANTTYVRGSDSSAIFTTNATRIFTFGTLTNSIRFGTQQDYWTGLQNAGIDWDVSTRRCVDWVNSNIGQTARYGLSDLTDYSSFSTGAFATCNNFKRLLCAEQ